MSEAIAVKQSPYAFDETIIRIERAVTNAGNTIFARIDQAAAARGAGVTLRPTVTLVFGNPKAGTLLMQTSPAFAVELPLKVAIWLDDDETVKLAFRSLTTLASTNPVPGQDALLRTLDERVSALLDTAIS